MQNLIDRIMELQQRAVQIRPPAGTDLLSAKGGLPGPAFFPEGLGLSGQSLRGKTAPSIMAIGHNFGCITYRNAIQVPGREDDKATWRNLDTLLMQAGSQPECCFRTNWFIGLLPGNQQVGKFLRRPDSSYEGVCNDLLIAQFKLLQPKTILVLGPEVAGRAYQIAPELAPWRNARRWVDIDRSSIGHTAYHVEVPAAELRVNVAALLHPSFGAANQSRRMKNMIKPLTEAEIIREALKA